MTTNYKKVPFERFVRDDNGQYFRIHGWYAKEFPNVYEQHIDNITDTFSEMA